MYAPNSIRPVKKQRLNTVSLMYWRMCWPAYMPMMAGTMAKADKPTFILGRPVCQSSWAAKANVDTVNDKPKAWMSSSLDKDRICK